MDFHDLTDLAKHPNVPGETVLRIFTISKAWTQIAEKIGQLAGALALPICWLIIAAMWCVLVPIQALAATAALLVRMLSGRGSFSHNAMMLCAPVGLFVAFGVVFGWDSLGGMLRALLFMH